MKWWLYLDHEKKWVEIDDETHEGNISYGESVNDVLILTDDLYISGSPRSGYWIEFRAKEKPA